MDEPFLPSNQKESFHYQALIFPLIIIFISSIYYFFPSLPTLVINQKNVFYIYPFFTSLFIQNDVTSFIVNPIFLFLLLSILLNYWSFQMSMIYSILIGILCNISTSICLSFLSFLYPFSFHISTSLSIIIALSCAICYSVDITHQRFLLFSKIPVLKNEIIISVMIWLLFNFRIPPSVFISGLFSYLFSYIILMYGQKYIKFPQNNDFYYKYLIPSFDNSNDSKSPLLNNVDLQNLASNSTLSEAEQTRRLRALRAIEERLESVQFK